ncbi:ankyrin, partial [Anaeromyces robustus]
MKGDIKQIQKYKEEGYSLSGKNEEGWSSLHIAVNHHQMETVKYLLNHGVNINIENNGCSPLFLACQNGDLNMVEILVEKNANINMMMEGWSPVQIACCNGYEEIVDYLLKRGANINSKDNSGATILHIAARENYYELAKYL